MNYFGDLCMLSFFTGGQRWECEVERGCVFLRMCICVCPGGAAWEAVDRMGWSFIFVHIRKPTVHANNNISAIGQHPLIIWANWFISCVLLLISYRNVKDLTLETWVAMFCSIGLVRFFFYAIVSVFNVSCHSCVVLTVSRHTASNKWAQETDYIFAAGRTQNRTQWHSGSVLFENSVLFRGGKETILTTEIPKNSRQKQGCRAKHSVISP